MDEGLAEYFEVNPDAQGVNSAHVRLLVELIQQGNWGPSLQRLESITDPTQLTQIDYAESWLWVHFLMSSPIGREVLKTGLTSAGSIDRVPWSVEIAHLIGNVEQPLLDHLAQVTQHR